jgi:hypothetical protein
MTGVSLFGQRAAQANTKGRITWTFDKAGYEAENQQIMDWTNSPYTHLLTERNDIATASGDEFQVVAVAQGNPRLDLRHARIETSDAIYVWERKGLWDATKS